MRDVAVRAGVTAATVSLSLRGSSEISAATRARVCEIARTMGYRQNPLVRVLMRSRRRRNAADQDRPVLAYVTGFPTRQGWRTVTTPVFLQMFEGARAQAEQYGYQLQEFWLHEADMTPRRFAEMLHARGIHGLIVAPLPAANMRLDLPWTDFAAVALGTTLVQPALHRVANDLFHSMLVAMEETYRLGYRRIGLALRTTVNEKVQRRWLAAYLLAERDLPGLARIEPLLAEPLNEAAFRSWFERERPDAIVATSPHDILQWLKAWGWRVPADVGVVSLSAPHIGDPMSGICQHAERMGACAVDLLVSLLERNELGVPAAADSLLVDGTWNPGRTLTARSPVARATGRRSGGSKKPPRRAEA
jgi:LacI family transcriptional regulator